MVITSNRTRELHDALKRRCLYHWIDFPDLEREVEIIRLRVPGVSEQLARAVADGGRDACAGSTSIKPPGAAEAIDWAHALTILGADVGGRRRRPQTLGWAVKNHDDLRRVEEALPELSP